MFIRKAGLIFLILLLTTLSSTAEPENLKTLLDWGRIEVNNAQKAVSDSNFERNGGRLESARLKQEEANKHARQALKLLDEVAFVLTKELRSQSMGPETANQYIRIMTDYRVQALQVLGATNTPPVVKTEPVVDKLDLESEEVAEQKTPQTDKPEKKVREDSVTSEGRTITTKDVRERQQAEVDLWNRYSRGEITAQEHQRLIKELK